MTNPTQKLGELLAEMKKREAAATPGPWNEFGGAVTVNEKVVAECAGYQDCFPDEWASNSQFIAHARMDYGRLIAALEVAVAHLEAERMVMADGRAANDTLADILAALEGK